MSARRQSQQSYPPRNPKHRFTSWLLQHLQSFIFSLGQFCRQPLASLITASVIGIALALPAGFYVVLENARHLTSGWEGNIQITVFLNPDIDDKTARQMTKILQSRDDIQLVKHITREQALEEYKRLSGFADAIDALDANPLPSLLLIQPRQDPTFQVGAEQLIAELQQLPGVDNAQYDQQWIERLYAIIAIIQRVIMILGLFLAVAVLLIVGNTIRMLIYQRRSEIEIAMLFGATNRFIRRPFLYSGFWYGLSGGLLAWIMVSLAMMFLQQPADALAQLYPGSFTLIGLGPREALIVIGNGVILGLVGSWISVTRHLQVIEQA